MNHFLRLRRAAVVLGYLATGASGLVWGASNPISQFYVTDVQGDVELDDGLRVTQVTTKALYKAEGSVIETKAASENSVVFSNGTGVYFSPETRIEVKRFEQEPFSPIRADLEIEPSISQTAIHVHRGTVALCTSRMVAGSSMVYSTPHALINIRGNQVVIETSEAETRVSLIDGDVTVRSGVEDGAGQLLQSGQQAIFRHQPGQPTFSQIQPIPPAQLPGLIERASLACMARRTVYFEAVESGPGDAAVAGLFDQSQTQGAQQIRPVPVVSTMPAVEHTVSISEMPSAGQ